MAPLARCVHSHYGMLTNIHSWHIDVKAFSSEQVDDLSGVLCKFFHPYDTLFIVTVLYHAEPG